MHSSIFKGNKYLLRTFWGQDTKAWGRKHKDKMCTCFMKIEVCVESDTAI